MSEPRYYDEDGKPTEDAYNRATDYGQCPEMGPVSYELARLQRERDRLAEELATERRTANQSLADEYDARRKAEGERDTAIARIEKAREVLEERSRAALTTYADVARFNEKKIDALDSRRSDGGIRGK